MNKKIRINNLGNLKHFRKSLREGITPQEQLIWNNLKSSQLGFKFRRQHGLGRYIVDFCCPSKRLIIELDGSQHQDNLRYDNERTHYLNSLGYRVLRFGNDQVNTNLQSVINIIQEELVTPPPNPLL